MTPAKPSGRECDKRLHVGDSVRVRMPHEKRGVEGFVLQVLPHNANVAVYDEERGCLTPQLVPLSWVRLVDPIAPYVTKEMRQLQRFWKKSSSPTPEKP